MVISCGLSQFTKLLSILLTGAKDNGKHDLFFLVCQLHMYVRMSAYMYVSIYIQMVYVGRYIWTSDIDRYFPFQALFQHIFNCVMEDIAEQVASTQHFSIEFEDKGTNHLMSLRFWKKNKLWRVFICRSALPSNALTGDLGSLSRLLS